jgi:hypothetical protein
MRAEKGFEIADAGFRLATPLRRLPEAVGYLRLVRGSRGWSPPGGNFALGPVVVELCLGECPLLAGRCRRPSPT